MTMGTTTMTQDGRTDAAAAVATREHGSGTRVTAAPDRRTRPDTIPAVELQHVSKSYGDVEALRDVSFAVAPGEVVALLGPNGAGKTTAIAIMLGLRRPTSGRATLFGLDPYELQARSRCGVMFQESGVPLSLTVRELVRLFRSYYPTPLPAERAIAMASLGDKPNVRAENLSGGQRQRLYFALAVCGDPDLIFLDEPTAGLDVESRQVFWQQIRDFMRAGKTILLTTHYLEEADALADRIVLIDRGRVIADESPAAIKSRVAGKRVSFDLTTPFSEDAFSGLPVQGLDLSAHRVRCLSPEPETVLRELFARGVPIRNLEVVGAGLDEAFLNLTQNGRG
jgi:ABC-2 type transport system ATP-binding protein